MFHLKKNEPLQIIRYDGGGKLDHHIESDRGRAWARYQEFVGRAMCNPESQMMIVLKDQKGIISTFMMGGRA